MIMSLSTPIVGYLWNICFRRRLNLLDQPSFSVAKILTLPFLLCWTSCIFKTYFDGLHFNILALWLLVCIYSYDFCFSHVVAVRVWYTYIFHTYAKVSINRVSMCWILLALSDSGKEHSLHNQWSWLLKLVLTPFILTSSSACMAALGEAKGNQSFSPLTVSFHYRFDMTLFILSSSCFLKC